MDAHFGEGFCRVEDENMQQALNVARKIALNCVKTHKQKTGSKLPLSRIMFGCLLDCEKLVHVLMSVPTPSAPLVPAASMRYNSPMVQGDTWFECGDGTRLFLMHRSPATQPAAVLHIVHGMAEHSGRYARLAEKLCEAGVEVWAADQRGHGKTANADVNGLGKGGLLGHCGDAGSFERVTSDIFEINMEIRKARPGIPLFLLGHSWGSFIAQNYIEQEAANCAGEKPIDGCILSGTRGPGGFKEKAGVPILVLLAALVGRRRGSPFARALADGPYSKAFRPNRTPFDWLSRDEAKVDAYCADSLCGVLCSAGFYRDMAKGLRQIHRPESMARIRADLPIFIFCGSADPAGEMGASPIALVNAYRSLGIRDMEFVLYPGARHEPLSETNREEVRANLLSWILKRASAQPDADAPGKEE